MTVKSLENAMTDKSISDKKFFKILLKYLSDQERKYRNSREDISSVKSPAYQKIESETNRLRARMEKLRPAVMEMLRQYVLKQHEHCCGPKSKK